MTAEEESFEWAELCPGVLQVEVTCYLSLLKWWSLPEKLQNDQWKWSCERRRWLQPDVDSEQLLKRLFTTTGRGNELRGETRLFLRSLNRLLKPELGLSAAGVFGWMETWGETGSAGAAKKQHVLLQSLMISEAENQSETTFIPVTVTSCIMGQSQYNMV